jgi:sulfate adenylyltransferase
METAYSYSESLLVHFRRIEDIKEAALGYPSISLNQRQLCDLELLVNRAFFPLQGFLTRPHYDSVLEKMRLADGALWPVPICLDIGEKLAERLEVDGRLCLADQEGFLLAVLKVEDVWKPDKLREARLLFGTDDPEDHPGVRRLLDHVKPWYVGGAVEGIHPPLHYDFKDLRLTPSETHRRFVQNGWRKVIAFQTEDYPHCAHKEMTLQAAREAGASILLHPIVGLGHPGDSEYFTKIRSYQKIVKRYPKNMIMLNLMPLAPRFAGPREALWQAIINKNYGCSHIMIDDDHADPFAVPKNNGTDRFYPRGAAQDLVKAHEKETGIRMAPSRRMIYVEEKAQYISEDQATEGMNIRTLSAVELQRRLEHGLEIPEWFSFPEVVEELRHAHPPRSRQGFAIFMTGLSGAGKSTIARALMVKFMEMKHRPVTLLDGDIVRTNLSSELGFSKEHRNLNIQRIGFVASEITKNGGIAICAPIAPYEESRRHNRELIGLYGGYVEVYIATPLETCEQRDRKGLYAKAKIGIVKGVTGVDDPYEVPLNPEITIDTSEMTPDEAAQEVLLYLEEQGYIR